MDMLFKSIGLDGKEAKAWTKILELGAQPVSVIAKHVGVPRSSMYVIINRLRNFGLVEEFEQSGMRYVKSIPVKELPDIFLVKERQIKQSLDILKENLPKLERIENKLSITPVVRFFEGKQAVMKMYEEVLKEKSFCAYFNPAVVSKIMPIYYEGVAKKVGEKGRNVKELLVNSPCGEDYKKRFESEKHQIKILPRGAGFFSDTIIGKERIYMISYGESQVSATEIRNPTLAQSNRVIFEELWERI